MTTMRWKSVVAVTLALWSAGCAAPDAEGDDLGERDQTAQSDEDAEQPERLAQSGGSARFTPVECDATRLPMVQAAADRALQLLRTQRSDAAFTKWFGAQKSNASVWSTYHVIFNNINTYAQESLQLLGAAVRETSASVVKIHCKGGRNGSLAHVTGQGASTIFLDNGFFAQPTTGRDSQAGILIHELTHLAATTDAARPSGVDAKAFAQELAQTQPVLALSNADNHQFYYEGL